MKVCVVLQLYTLLLVAVKVTGAVEDTLSSSSKQHHNGAEVNTPMIEVSVVKESTNTTSTNNNSGDGGGTVEKLNNIYTTDNSMTGGGGRVVDEKRVLILHPMYAASHVLSLRALSKALVARGHKVTVVRWQDTHHYPPSVDPNIREIVLALNNTDGTIPHMTVQERASFIMPLELMWGKGTDWTALPLDAFLTISAVCDALLRDQHLRQHLRLQRFDVAIVDLIYNECSLALAHDLGVPSVGYWAFTFAGGEPQYTTAFSPPSSVPLILTHYRDVMTFPQRLVNHLHALASHAVMQVEFLVTGYQIWRHLPTCPWPSTLVGDLSGMLINSHPALDYPRLLPPSFINVGGLQIHEPRPLPQDLDSWLSGSGEVGTILFSMGFIFNPGVVPSEVIRNLMQAFSRLQQRVLMKYDVTYPDPPPNVKLVDWLPQQDVLSHPRTVLFFTHCGMHGVLESLHHGVPMVGMPVFADQLDVLVRLEERGVARGLDKRASSEQIYETLVATLTNSSYRENAHRMSKILRHQTQDPMARALWLVEHVANTQGAPHLKFAARHLNFFQFFGLDVMAFVVVLVFLLRHLLRVFRCIGAHLSDGLASRNKLKES